MIFKTFWYPFVHLLHDFEICIIIIYPLCTLHSIGSPTLSKLLTPRAAKGSTPSTNSTSPSEAPHHQPLLSAAAKATAAKEAAKILLGGVRGGAGAAGGGADDQEVCGTSRGFQSAFSSFVTSVSVSLTPCNPPVVMFLLVHLNLYCYNRGVVGNNMVAPPFYNYNALYGISYRLPNVTWTVAVGVHYVVRVVKWGSNHDIAKLWDAFLKGFFLH